MVPTFRNDVEAVRFAETHEPMRQALSEPNDRSYSYRYGDRAAEAAERCRTRIIAGDMQGAHIASLALSVCLFQDRPHLFDKANGSSVGRSR